MGYMIIMYAQIKVVSFNRSDVWISKSIAHIVDPGTTAK